jgi:non-ribosomal peptide synthetase component E (peptide arylation enzyme)
MLRHHYMVELPRRFPEKSSTICATRAYSFEPIGQASDRLACGFQSLENRRGNRVGVMLLEAARTQSSSFLLEEKP